MKIDILLCIDGTSSMVKVIEDVKGNVSQFVNNLISGLKENSDNQIERIRIKFCVFRNADYDGDNWYQETPFYDLSKSHERLNSFLKDIQAIGGSPETNEEDGLMALSNVLSYSNWNSRKEDIQIIGIWTDTGSKPINPRHKELKEHAPSSYEGLKEYWNSIFLGKYPNARILLFAPDVFPWNKILEQWPNSIHYKSDRVGLDHENPEVFLIENLLGKLTPSYDENLYDSLQEPEEDKHNQSETEEVKPSTIWGRYRKYITFSIAILSFSLISARVIGFSIFSVNVEYTKSVNDSNTEEFKRQLDEITTVLKREGLLSESTEIDYSSRIETRHGVFFDDYDLVLRYSMELSVQDYLLGQYSIREVRETMTSAGIIAEHLNLVENTYSHTGPIKVTVIGETDATPIKNGIPYNGEIGKILDASFTYDDNKYAVRLKEGDLIVDNVELGILRASSIWSHIKSLTNIFIPKQTYVDFEVVTHEEFGGTFRKSTLIVRLYDLENFE